MASTGDAFASLLQIPGLQELLNTQVTSARQQEPLRTGATQTALGMLPNSSFGGSSARPDVSAIPRANFATPAPKDGNALANALKYLAAGGAGALAGNAASGGNMLKTLTDWLTGRNKNIFGGKTTVSNDYDPFSYDPNDPLTGGPDWGSLPGYGTPPSNGFEGLPGYGTPLPSNPFQDLPGYGTPLPPMPQLPSGGGREFPYGETEDWGWGE